MSAVYTLLIIRAPISSHVPVPAVVPRFYQWLGFSAVGSHVEPVTGSAYTIMKRT
jgi:hypothetical protein